MLIIRIFTLLILAIPPVLALAADTGTNEVISPDAIGAQTTSALAKAMYAHRNDDLHAVWIEERPTGSEVYYYKFKNSTSSWLEGVPMTDGAQAHDATISGDYRGNLQVAWEEEGRIYHRMWNITSERWEEADLVAENASDPIVLCDRSPNTHFIWVQRAEPGDDSPSFLSHRMLTPQGEWTEATPFSPMNAYSTEVGVGLDQRNGLHVVWKMTFDLAKPYDLFYAYRQAGREWGPFERILDGSERNIRNPAAAADKDNFAHIVWEEGSTEASKIYYRTWKGSWGDPMLVVDSPGSARNPVLAADDGLNIHLVWEDTRDGGDPEIYFRRLWPLGIWSSIQRLTTGHSSLGESTPPRSEISSRTRDLHILWSEVKGGVSQVYHRIWPGRRREDVPRTASKARSEIAEVQRQPFVSGEAKEKYDEAVEAYDAGLDSLRDFDVDAAKESFLQVIDLLDQGYVLEEEYKENLGRNMGLTLAIVGGIGGVVILVPWLILRGQET